MAAVRRRPGASLTGQPERRAAPGQSADLRAAQSYRADPEAVELVNAALYLRRPLLVTGKPGTGESGLAFSVAWELGLGPVLRWRIASRSPCRKVCTCATRSGACRTRAGATAGPMTRVQSSATTWASGLGTALLPYEHPRVLLIDEMDKSDVDLPNDLLNLFEYPEYRIPELTRVADRVRDVRSSAATASRVTVSAGLVRCTRSRSSS